MAIAIRNFTSGRDVVLGRLGVDEIISVGAGRDSVITGGRGGAGTGFVEVRTGTDFGVKDQAYNESFAGFGNPWVGGHDIYTVNGQRYERGGHFYELGAIMDEGRISLPGNYGMKVNGEYVIADIIVEGMFTLHGRGAFGKLMDGSQAQPTRLKNVDFREGAQKITVAAESLDDVNFTRIKGEMIDTTGDVFQFRADQYDLQMHHDSPILDEQWARVDHYYMPTAAQVILDIDRADYLAAPYESQREALREFYEGLADDNIFIMGG